MSVVKKALSFGGGVVSAQLITALSIPLLTRLYSPQDFADFGLLFSISLILTPLATLKFELLLPKSTKIEQDIPSVFNIILITFIPLWILAFLVVSFVKNEFDFYNIILSLLAVLGAGAFSMFHAINISNIRNNNLKIINTGLICRSSAAITFQFLLAGTNKFGLFYGEIIGRILGLTVISKKSYYRLLMQKTLYSLKSNLKYLKYVVLAGLINSAGLNLYPILMLKFYDPILVGKYFFVYRVLTAPISVVAQSISISLLGDFNSIFKQEPEKIIKKLHKITLIIFLSSFVVFLLISLFLKYTAVFFLGKEWEGIYVYVYMVLPFLVGQISFSHCSQLLVLLGGEKKQLAWDVSRLVMLIISVFLPLNLNVENPFFLSLGIYSIISFFMYSIHYGMVINAIKKNKESCIRGIS